MQTFAKQRSVRDAILFFRKRTIDRQREPMPSIDDVYLKFGFASEAAQLLETELGTLLFRSGAIEANLFENPNHDMALELLRFVNRKTLGQLIRSLSKTDQSIDDLYEILKRALCERNRLAHSFYREHNNRQSAVAGRV